MTRLVAACVVLCFFVSGLGSLILEVVWTRMLRLVFGSTTLAVSTVLVAYMLGLGLGGLAGGRLARRFERRRGRAIVPYGVFELVIAAYALAVPMLLGALPLLERSLLYDLSFWPAALVRFALSVALLLVPTFLMGATLPLVTSSLVRDDDHAGRWIALLYGVNTLGAVVGVLLATFVLFGSVGLTGTNAVGAGLDAIAGLLALAVLARHFAPLERRASEAPPAKALPGRTGNRGRAGDRWLPPVIAYGCVGFTALVYEVAWTRALSMILGSSIYAFAAMLSSFLAGIALGSLLARSFVDRLRRPLLVFAVGIALLGLLSLGSLFVLPLLPRLFAVAVARFGFSSGALVPVHFATSVLAMLPPTLVLGALFPLLARALTSGPGGAGEAVGRVYFANTVGSAGGAFLAGFVLIPALGVRATIGAAVALNLLTAAVLVARGVELAAPLRALAAVALCVAAAAPAVAPLGWDRLLLARGAFLPEHARELVTDVFLPEGIPKEELVFYRDGLNSTASVHRFLERYSLNVNGKPDASSVDDMPTQVLNAHVPLLFGPPARDVLVIGLASGVTAGSAARHDLERLVVVELEPAMVAASRFFDAQSGAPLDDPRVELVLDDARTYVRYGSRHFDVIVSEPSNPWMTGASALFTREHLEAARDALRPGGRLLQWVHLYGMDRAGLASVLATLRAVFPHVYGFVFERGYADLMLLATSTPLGKADLPVWETLSEPVRADLERVGLFATEDLWSLLRLGPEDVDRLIGPDPTLNLDSNLFIELRTPWALYEETLDDHWGRFEASTEGIARLARTLLGDAGEATDALACSYVERRLDAAAARAALSAASGSATATACQAAVAHARGELDPISQLQALDAAAALDPHSFWPRLLRSSARREAGVVAGARADAEAALRSRPRDVRAQIALARALASGEQRSDAAQWFEQILATPYGRSERGFRLHADAIRLYLFGGRLEDGVRHLEALLAREPFAPDAWQLLAEAYGALGRGADADRAQGNAARLEARGLTGAAARLVGQGRTQQAIELLERATRLDPDFARAREDLAELR